MILDSPLSVYASSKKDFSINLNEYRNSHYQILNKAKINYKAVMHQQIMKLPKMDKIKIHYTIYPETKRLCDIGNIVSITKKFFEDALVEFKRIPDDNYNHVIGSSESFGCVDKDNPRVVILITEM
jgi:hypothetical protein